MSASSSPSPASGARRGRPGYDRETLIQVCVAVFNRHGYGTTSMGMLGEELGISKSAIYHHVGSKEEILQEALDRALDALEAMMAQARAGQGRAVDHLEGLLRGSVEVLVDQMPSVTLLLRLRGNTTVEQAALERRRRITREVEDLVRRAQEDGDLRPDLPTKASTRLMMGMVNSIVEWYRPEGLGTPEQLAETVVAMVMGGVRA